MQEHFGYTYTVFVLAKLASSVFFYVEEKLARYKKRTVRTQQNHFTYVIDCIEFN